MKTPRPFRPTETWKHHALLDLLQHENTTPLLINKPKTASMEQMMHYVTDDVDGYCYWYVQTFQIACPHSYQFNPSFPIGLIISTSATWWFIPIPFIHLIYIIQLTRFSFQIGLRHHIFILGFPMHSFTLSILAGLEWVSYISAK